MFDEVVLASLMFYFLRGLCTLMLFQTCLWCFKFLYFLELEIPVNFSRLKIRSCLLILVHYLHAFSLLTVDLASLPFISLNVSVMGHFRTNPCLLSQIPGFRIQAMETARVEYGCGRGSEWD
jgi:hypothetical protein